MHQIRADLFVRLLDGRYNGYTCDQIISALLAEAAADAGGAGMEDGAPSEASGDVPQDAAAGHSSPTGVSPPVGGSSPTEESTPTGEGAACAEARDAESAENGSGADGPTAAPDRPGGDARREGAGDDRRRRAGVEIRVALSTLLGLDDHPGELPGWGPVLAEEARLLVARQHRAGWRFAVTDHDGHLIHGGLTRRRPPPLGDATGCAGGVVEIHVPATLLTELARHPDVPTEWAPLIADIARRYAHYRRHGEQLDAHPRARFPRARLRCHIQMRDRTCVAPGCRRPALKAEQDHTRSHHHGGPTTAGNLEPLCARHHLMKHEGGWQLVQPEPGRFRWRSPLGRTYRTRGEPLSPDLPAPVPRGPEYELDDDATTRMIDGPIFHPLVRNPPRTDPPAPRPPPVDEPPPF